MLGAYGGVFFINGNDAVNRGIEPQDIGQDVLRKFDFDVQFVSVNADMIPFRDGRDLLIDFPVFRRHAFLQGEESELIVRKIDVAIPDCDLKADLFSVDFQPLGNQIMFSVRFDQGDPLLHAFKRGGIDFGKDVSSELRKQILVMIGSVVVIAVVVIGFIAVLFHLFLHSPDDLLPAGFEICAAVCRFGVLIGRIFVLAAPFQDSITNAGIQIDRAFRNKFGDDFGNIEIVCGKLPLQFRDRHLSLRLDVVINFLVIYHVLSP